MNEKSLALVIGAIACDAREKLFDGIHIGRFESFGTSISPNFATNVAFFFGIRSHFNQLNARWRMLVRRTARNTVNSFFEEKTWRRPMANSRTPSMASKLFSLAKLIQRSCQ